MKHATTLSAEEMAADLKKKLKYGIRYSDGTYETSPDMWDKRDAGDIVVQTPEEMNESGIGMCHDVTQALLRRLKENRIRGTAVMLKGDHEPNLPTHSFVVTKKDRKYTVLDPLSYDSGYKGGYRSMDDAISGRIDDWKKEDEKGDVVSSKIRARDWKKRGLLDFLRYGHEKKAESYSLKGDPTYEDALKVFNKLDFDDRANLVPRHPDFLRKVPDDMLFDRQVAVDGDGNPVGFQEFYLRKDKRGRHLPPHNIVAVAPEARGNGLARLMAEAAVRKARKEKIKRLVWEAFADNEPSIRAALSAGFRDATPKKAKTYRKFVYDVEKKAQAISPEEIEAMARPHYPDEGSHGWNHIEDVLASARRMRRKELLKKELAALMYHDSSLLTGPRETHAEDSAEIARKELAGRFSKRQLADIANAIAHHRASYEGRRKSRLEDLVAAADRNIPDVDKSILRSYRYGLEHGMTEEEAVSNTLQHMPDKYGTKGYAYRNIPKIYLETYGDELAKAQKGFDAVTAEKIRSLVKANM